MRRVTKRRVCALLGAAACVTSALSGPGCGSDDDGSALGICCDDGSVGGFGGSSGFVGTGGAFGGASGTAGSGGTVGSGGTSGGAGGASGTAGAPADAGAPSDAGDDAGISGCTSACCPTEPECFPSGVTSPGAECLAQRTNTPDRFQLRQAHRSALSPPGYAEDPLYAAGARGAELPWPACGTPDGTAASIELIDVDLSDPDPSRHVARRGYATHVDAAALDAARTDGLCFVEGAFFDAAWFLDSGLVAAAGTPLGLPPPLPQPWVARPAQLQRVSADFDLSTDRAMILSSLAASGFDGVFFYDPASGRWHDYVPLYYQVFYESSGSASVVPAREVETEFSFNSAAQPDCVGALVEPAAGCASSDPLDPVWGCASDGCPGGAPSRARGYLLTTELEQVWSDLTSSTLCVAAPTLDQAQRDGWSGPGTWGLNCRGSPNWDPETPDTGLPTGDWCSATNAPSTAECHDAYRIETQQAFSAFPIRSGACHVGPASAPASGACPGSAMVLAADQTERVAASGVALSTAGANCAAGAASGGIWAVTANDAGTLRLNAVPQRDASGSLADAVISVRSDCAKSTTTRACSRSGPGEVERLAHPIAAGQTLYVLVQSAAPFELFATLESARCGDGVLNAGEQCDFGDTLSADGCDAACQYETPASSDVCPGEVMSVSRGQTLILDRHTVGYGDEYDAPCGARVGGPDRVFGVNPTTSGTLRASLSSTFDGVLSVHASCVAPRLGALLGCSDGPRANDVEAVSTQVTGGLQYFVVVDGYRAESFGPFELRLELE